MRRGDSERDKEADQGVPGVRRGRPTQSQPESTGADAIKSTGNRSRDTSGEVTAGTPSIAFSSPADGTVTPSGQALTLTAAVTYDGDPQTLLVEWTSSRRASRLGENHPNAAGVAQLEVQNLEPGLHTITATVSAPTGATGTATLDLRVNSAPSSPVVSITPASPSSSDDLTATIVTPATDADGDAISYGYRWLENGVDSGLQTATIAHAATAEGETWKVFVTATDGFVDALPASSEVTIGNTAPTCTGASLLPSAAKTDATFRCSCLGRVDPDASAAAQGGSSVGARRDCE